MFRNLKLLFSTIKKIGQLKIWKSRMKRAQRSTELKKEALFYITKYTMALELLNRIAQYNPPIFWECITKENMEILGEKYEEVGQKT